MDHRASGLPNKFFQSKVYGSVLIRRKGWRLVAYAEKNDKDHWKLLAWEDNKHTIVLYETEADWIRKDRFLTEAAGERKTEQSSSQLTAYPLTYLGQRNFAFLLAA